MPHVARTVANGTQGILHALKSRLLIENIKSHYGWRQARNLCDCLLCAFLVFLAGGPGLRLQAIGGNRGEGAGCENGRSR